MSKFKVGDKVKFIHSDYTDIPDEGWNVGNFGKIVFVDTYNLYVKVVRFSFENEFPGGLAFYPSELELVTETPQPSFVKLIPEQVIPARREIVETVVKIAGVDAILLSKHHETDMPCGASEIGIQINMIFTADDLREASNVFLELASILEENAK